MDLALQIGIAMLAGVLGGISIWYCPPKVAAAAQKCSHVLLSPFILLSNPILRWLGIIDKD